MMNKKAGIMLSVWFGLAIFLLGVTFVNFLIPDVDSARINLNCSSASSISSGNKMLCLLSDVAVPYWIILVLSASGGVVLDRLLA